MSTDPDSQQEASDSKASQQPDQDGKNIDKKSDDVADPLAQEKQNPNASSELIVLSPHFDEEHHGIYVRKLEQAVMLPEVRNIALTGGYGTGKSSVIQGLIEKIHSSKEFKKIRPIVISLPTTQIADESDSGDNRTDRIQREIVKQLLYRSNPRKMRGSQYRRITHVTATQRATVCFIVAAILTSIFWLLAKPDWHWAQGGSLWGYWQPAMVQAILWGLTFYVDWMWVNKPAIKGLQLGPAKLELGKSDSSYFDKYLNEIIYYFEVSGANLVIFEDLDRFNDPYIFDALHELNELINISLGQERFTEQKNPSVKFLYATRDSIFEHKTKGIIENADTRYTHRLEIENRTKFFDVIVPIVPFSTSRNAYEYLKQMIDSSTFSIEIDLEIDRKLLEIVGSEISDYRLLANIVSEFQIFTKQIVASWGGNENTKEFLNDHANYLFAFIVYKNTHLTDYEKIQIGESNIDKLNIVFLETVTNINEIIDGIFNNLGDKLRKYIIKKFGPYEYKIVINDTSFNIYSDIKLWESAIYPKIYGLTENFPDISLVDSSTTLTTIINGEFLMKMMISELKDNTPEAFLMYRENEISNYFKEIIREIFSIADLTTPYTDDFSVLSLRLSRYNNIDLEGSRFIDKIQKEINKFIDFTEKKFGNDRMAQELINNQFINGSFHVYSSVFNGEFYNSRTFNFIIQHVMKGAPNVAFQLNEKESREIVYQIERHYLNRHYSLTGALNADLMLYLEKHRSNSIVLSCMLNEVADSLKYNYSDTIEGLINKIKQIGGKQDSNYEYAKRLLHKIKDYAAAVNISAEGLSLEE